MNQDLLARFRSCREAGTADEGRLAALVAQLLDPDLDATVLETKLDAMAAGCPAGVVPWRFLAEHGFTGNSADYVSLDNSHLGRVLETRRGIPITLGVVLIRVARASGSRSAGVNFPGHFLVRVDEVLVDPFVMQPVEPEKMLERLPEQAREAPAAALFPEASPLEVGLRMLNNVRMVFVRQASWHLALDVLDAQLELAPEQPVLHLERGDVWRRLGSAAPARSSWQRALALAESLPPEEAGPVRQAVRRRLDELGGSGDVLH